jgi:hypothetical protein
LLPYRANFYQKVKELELELVLVLVLVLGWALVLGLV